LSYKHIAKYLTYTKNAYSKQLKFDKYMRYMIHTYTKKEKYTTQIIDIRKKSLKTTKFTLAIKQAESIWQDKTKYSFKKLNFNCDFNCVITLDDLIS